MVGLPILDIAIGLTFVYLLLSLICTTINEGIAATLTSRAGHLKDGITKLIPSKVQQDVFYAHPLISALCQKSKHPSYIPARTFALAVLDVVAPPQAGGAPHDLESLRSALAVGRTPLETAVVALADKGSKDLAELRQNIENWFNDSMDRLTGWYKRRTQWILLVLSIAISIGFNADSVAITKGLFTDNALRTAVSQAAQNYMDKKKADKPAGSATFPTDSLTDLTKGLNALKLPIGWGAANPGPCDVLGWLGKVLGWLITAIAVSLGAPFWFDTLNKIMQLRSSVKPPYKPTP